MFLNLCAECNYVVLLISSSSLGSGEENNPVLDLAELLQTGSSDPTK